jgi:hypothetical protein
LLDLVEQGQAATLTDVEERIDTRARQMQSVLAELRITPAQRPKKQLAGHFSGLAISIGR